MSAGTAFENYGPRVMLWCTLQTIVKIAYKLINLPIIHQTIFIKHHQTIFTYPQTIFTSLFRAHEQRVNDLNI